MSQKKKPSTQKAAKKSGPSLQSFIDDSKAEFSKIEWPSRQASVNAFVTVVLIVVGFTVFVAASDAALSQCLNLLRGI